MTSREKLIDLLRGIYAEPYKTCPFPKGEPDCNNCKYQVNENLCNIAARTADYLIKNGVVLLKQPTPPTNLKGKCGSCIFAKPTTFGTSTVYVECTNVEHIGQWCKRQISYKRQRTHKACKRYQERSLTDATQ